MNTQLRFKLIALLISLSLVGLISFQGYWLYGLYRTLYIQMEGNIHEAMKLADYKELFIRILEIKQKKKDSEHGVHSLYVNSDSVARYTQTANPYEATPDSVSQAADRFALDISYDEKDISEAGTDSTLSSYLNAMGKIESMVQSGLHTFADSLIPIRFETYDSLLTAELKARQIDTRYRLYLVCETKNSSTAYIKPKHKHPQPDSLFAPTDWPKSVYFGYTVQTLKADPELTTPLHYRLYLQNPAAIVLRQMLGILLSSFLLLILIVIAFIYLLRTILRQKTVEEMKTDFTNNMTHELKTPISVCYAATDVLLDYNDAVSEKQRKYLNIVKEQLAHLAGLVEQILTLAVENRSTFRLHPEPIRADKLLHSLIEQYKLKAPPDTVFATHIPEGLTLTADRTHLYNMLSNLIDNALKYSGQTPCRISISATQSKTETNLTIADNGPGIGEAYRQHIFDRFYRIPSGNLHDTKGFGLGLYYVKEMMQKHHGDITLSSHPGEGATFTLHFKN